MKIKIDHVILLFISITSFYLCDLSQFSCLISPRVWNFISFTLVHAYWWNLYRVSSLKF